MIHCIQDMQLVDSTVIQKIGFILSGPADLFGFVPVNENFIFGPRLFLTFINNVNH